MKRQPGPLRGERLEAVLDRLPSRPGVYLMKGARDEILYVGKARDLRSRVRSYFRASGDSRAFVSQLGRKLHEIEFVVTPTEKDALLLERDLIARHQPRFNVDLRDDKSFLCLRVGARHPFPRLMVDRRRPRLDSPRARAAGGRWFGPYTSAAHTRETFRLLQQLFGLRSCTDATLARRSRPCLLHQIGRCAAPCCERITQEAYQQRVRGAIAFLQGRTDDLIAELRERMQAASDALRFEEAALYRDRLRAVEATLRRKQVTGADLSLDVLGVHREGSSGVIVLLQIRRGYWLGAARHPFGRIEASTADLIRQFIVQHYAPGADIPAEILVPAESCEGGEQGEPEVIAQWLTEQRGARVVLASASRGRRKQLVDMARDNAVEAFRTRLAVTSTLRDRLQRLQRSLGLQRLPVRIECFDLSTSGGKSSTGSMAVMIDGEVQPSAYRRFRIRESAPDSDVDMMREVVRRRFRTVLEGSEEPPDLVLLDGGAGQLRAVQALFEDLGIVDVELAALAKGAPGPGRHKADRERVFLPGRKNPVRLRPESDELFLLSRVRDEAHRFAVRYHRALRGKASMRSVLEEIDGVGPVLRRRLLRRFGSLAGIKGAGAAELAGVKGVSQALAGRIHAFLAAGDEA
ncbi:MAG: excinuclease ABC subunit UvrC [Deltaproteobacteria bacterium]|nr:excinuclease ABC subunit UvrC [Deltaproteobacteria bacterium]